MLKCKPLTTLRSRPRGPSRPFLIMRSDPVSISFPGRPWRSSPPPPPCQPGRPTAPSSIVLPRQTTGIYWSFARLALFFYGASLHTRRLRFSPCTVQPGVSPLRTFIFPKGKPPRRRAFRNGMRCEPIFLSRSVLSAIRFVTKCSKFLEFFPASYFFKAARYPPSRTVEPALPREKSQRGIPRHRKQPHPENAGDCRTHSFLIGLAAGKKKPALVKRFPLAGRRAGEQRHWLTEQWKGLRT